MNAAELKKQAEQTILDAIQIQSATIYLETGLCIRSVDVTFVTEACSDTATAIRVEVQL